MIKMRTAVLIALLALLVTGCSSNKGESGPGQSSEFDAETYLPPAAPAFPDQDVEGIDQNTNGVRDEVEVMIFETLGLRGAELAAALSAAKELQRALLQDDALVEDSLNTALERFVATWTDPVSQLQAVDLLEALHSATYNTLPRALALLRAEQGVVARSAADETTMKAAEPKNGRPLFNPLGDFDRPSRFNGCVNPVSIISLNGINTTRREAVLNQIKLIKTVDIDLFDNYGIRPRFALIYNPSQSLVNDTIQSLFQVLEQQGFDTAAISSGAYELLNLLGDFYLIGGVDQSFAESFFVSQIVGRYPLLAGAVRLFVESTVRVAEAFRDLSEERAEVEARFLEIVAGSEGAPSIIVAHSQGNLFAVDFVNALTPEARKRVGVVHIATPSAERLGPYVTRFDDQIMNLARQVVADVPPGNIASSSRCINDDCDANGQAGHNLIGDYLGDGIIQQRVSSVIYQEATRVKGICFCERDGPGDSMLRSSSVFGEELFRVDFSVQTPLGNLGISEVLTDPGETYPGQGGARRVEDGLSFLYVLSDITISPGGQPTSIPGRFGSTNISLMIPSEAGEFRLIGLSNSPVARARKTRSDGELYGACAPDVLEIRSSGLLPMCFSEDTGSTTYALLADARIAMSPEKGEFFFEPNIDNPDKPFESGEAPCQLRFSQGMYYRGCPDPDFIGEYLARNPNKLAEFRRNSPQCYPPE